MTPLQLANDPPILVIDDMYTEQELSLIWNELAFLTSSKRLRHASKTQTAENPDGTFKKTATGVYLDSFYVDRTFSDILEVNRKLFSQVVYDHAVKTSIFYGLLQVTNDDRTLINYYDNSQEYTPHFDWSVFTAITVFYKEPVRFKGGDLVFPQIDVTVEKKNNRTIVFPGSLQHAVTPVEMQENYPEYSGYGRYSMAQFLTVK